jgi:hypothetical protein
MAIKLKFSTEIREEGECDKPSFPFLSHTEAPPDTTIKKQTRKTAIYFPLFSFSCIINVAD